MALQPSTALQALLSSLDGRTGPVTFEDLRTVVITAAKVQEDSEYYDYMGEDM